VQAVGISPAELKALFSNSLIRERDAATGDQIFDIAQTQKETKLSQTKWLMISEGNDGGRYARTEVCTSGLCRMNTQVARFVG